MDCHAVPPIRNQSEAGAVTRARQLAAVGSRKREAGNHRGDYPLWQTDEVRRRRPTVAMDQDGLATTHRLFESPTFLEWL